MKPAWLVAAALGLAATASAESGENAPPWMEWNYATGDWGGNRPLIDHRGVELFATYTAQVWGNVAGGIQPGATCNGLMQFGLEADLGPLIGWEGATFNTTWIWISGGRATTDYTGALFLASSTEAPVGFRALDLWLQQKFSGDVFTLRLGMFNADRDFTISEGASLFLNAGFGWPLLYAGRLGGPPAYPFAAPGLYGAVEPGGGWKFQAAVMQGEVWPPSQDPTGFYWRLDRYNGLLFLGEAQYVWKHVPLPGTAKFGAVLDGGFADYTDNPDSSWGGSFFYGIIDQMIWREPGVGSPQGISLFGRAGFSGTPDRNPVGMLLNAGCTRTGPFPGRDDDAAGFGLVWTRLSPGQASGLPGDERGNEFVLEATYEAQLTPWFELQPDVQFVVFPGGSNALPGALVLGMSASITF